MQAQSLAIVTRKVYKFNSALWQQVRIEKFIEKTMGLMFGIDKELGLLTNIL